MVVRDGAKRDVGTVDDGVACAGIASLHSIRRRVIVVIGLKPDRSGIGDDTAIGERRETRKMRVTAQDQRFAAIPGPFANFGVVRLAHAALFDRVEEMVEVAGRRPVAKQHVRRQTERRRQTGKPGKMPRREPVADVGESGH